jgi:hypothetical protein
LSWIVPLVVPGGNPAITPDGLSPRSLARTVAAPVLVTPAPASTEYDAALPRSTNVAVGVGAGSGTEARAGAIAKSEPTTRRQQTPTTPRELMVGMEI